jgi:2-amino-4-hydroxy-6-hydroxymethyldihydropteridine diphosphokinase/dihydropteroate synthase
VKAFIALGSNLGDPLINLEKAAVALGQLATAKKLRASPVFRNPALVPDGAPKEWNLPFLNAVVELEWGGGAPELLRALKKIEQDHGRLPSARWAPRVIDLDLLALGSERLSSSELILPHPEAARRAFVLDPWKHLAPDFVLPGTRSTILALSRRLSARSPLWMGILNLTPDSFSDGGELGDQHALERKITRWEQSLVHALDLGAESTRPGAAVVSEAEERARLEPALRFLKERYHGRVFRPLVSVDTRHGAVAATAVELGADILNDVSGLADPAYLNVLKNSSCQYVLMHSLTVPADPKVLLPPAEDPVRSLILWAGERLERLSRAGISLERVIFDPGLGFGKSAEQNLEILRRAEELFSLPVRVLIGHSRKSFLRSFGERQAGERDGFSVGISLRLAALGAELLRVHEPQLHADAHNAFQEVKI